MSNNVQPLDLKELRSSQRGEGLEALTRALGYRLNLNPQYSGRGADGGKDLIFREVYHGALTDVTIKWLVSCKDYAESGKSVTETDLPNNLALKLKQHNCSGFLLVTTTVISTGAKDLLDGVDRQHEGQYYTRVWDENDLRGYLLRAENSDLLRQFFPDSYTRVKGFETLRSALEHFEDDIPPAVYSLLIAKLPILEDKSLHGSSIWPEDAAAANQIDLIVSALQFQSNVENAQHLCEKLASDAFVALISALIKKDRESAYSLLLKVVHNSKNSDLKRNAAQYLLDRYDFEDEEKISDILLSLDESDFENIFMDMYSDKLSVEIINGSPNSGVESDLNTLGGIPSINWAYITELKAMIFHYEVDDDGDDYVELDGLMDIEFSITFDNDQDTETWYALPGAFTAEYNRQGFHLTSASVDLRKFYKDSEFEDLDSDDD